MAITDKEQGVWDVDQVYNKINQGGIWKYNGAAGEPGGIWQTRSTWFGRLGLNQGSSNATDLNYSSPVMAPGVYTQASASIISVHTRANDGSIWSWGYNNDGNLGQNDTISRSQPTQIGTDTDWSNMYYNHARKTDGSLYAWGPNYGGLLGLNQPTPSKISSPTQVGTDTTWSTEANARIFTNTWLKTDGTMWVWGYGSMGSLGLNESTANRSSPTQIPGYTMAKMGHIGPDINASIGPTGTLYMWGDNRQGELGLNQGPSKYPWQPYFSRNHHDKSAPNAVPGNWSKVVGGQNNVLATKTDGTLWYWGYGGPWNGAGPTAPTKKSSPTQVGTDTTWTGDLWNNGDSSAAIKTDGTLWTWGMNPNGALGHNDTTEYSSPKQVPGTWTSLEQGPRSIIAIKPG